MRGQVEPPGWEDRFNISRENWREKFLLYERDLAVQKDMEYGISLRGSLCLLHQAS